MRRVIVSMNVTLDGFMSGPNGELDWHFPFWNEEMSNCACEQLSTMDTIVAGRVTYQSMADYWPFAPSGPFTDMMNNHTKIVFSASLQKGEWNNTRVVNENIYVVLTTLKLQPGKNMIVYGSGMLVSSLIALDMIDEYRIWVHPVVLGTGKALFKSPDNKMNLKLLRTKTFGTGVILLYYLPGEKSLIL